MWLFTKFGFFSVVRKQGRDDLTVRARVRDDLVQLQNLYLPGLHDIRASDQADYRYRGNVSTDEFSRALARIALDIDYDNFKSEVGRAQGYERAHIYGDVWRELLQLGKVDTGR